MEQDGERGGVGGEDDELGDTTVKRLGRLVGTLLNLSIMGALLYLDLVSRRREVCGFETYKVQDFLGQSLVSLGPGGAVVFGHFESRVGCG